MSRGPRRQARVESRDKPALASGDSGVRVASQLVEIGAFLIPDNQIAAPVERLDVARHDVRHQSKTLCSGPTGELHQIAHMHVLVAVVEIEFPAWQGIRHHQIYIAVLTLGRLARTSLADGPLRHRSGRECQRNRHTYAEPRENPAHSDLLSVNQQRLYSAFKSPRGTPRENQARRAISYPQRRNRHQCPTVYQTATPREVPYENAILVLW